MSKRSTAAVLIIVAVVLGLGAWWFIAAQPNQPTTTPEPSTPTSSEDQQPTPQTDESAGITIVFTNSGFEEQNYSVAAGQTVTVKNESSMTVEFSSDEHPTHTDNAELNMSALQPGQQATFTPERTGEWGIHDHEHPEFTTTLSVTN